VQGRPRPGDVVVLRPGASYGPMEGGEPLTYTLVSIDTLGRVGVRTPALIVAVKAPAGTDGDVIVAMTGDGRVGWFTPWEASL
jgi:hypothetical protein